MSVLSIVAGVVLIAVAVFSTDPPLTYAWAAGLPLLMAGIAAEHRLAMRRRRARRVPPRALRYRVSDTRGFERGQMVDVDGRLLRIVAVDTLERDLYVEEIG